MSIRSFTLRACVAGAAVVSASVNSFSHAAEPLTLAMSQHLALESQPLIDEQAAAVDARRERAVAAGQLPDPEVQIGINDLPVNTTEAWSFRRDDFTNVMVGVMQEFPRPAKRRLRQLRETLAARGEEDTLLELERRVRRDTGLAFLEVYQSDRVRDLVRAQAEQASLQRQAVEIRLKSAMAPQSDLHAASVDAALLRDRVAESEQMRTHARLQLSRWIGHAAHQPTAAALPQLPEPPQLAALLANLPTHPLLRREEQNREIAATDLQLAHQAYKPDWRLEVGYAYRPEFSELLTVRAAVDLPMFRRNRQDREAAAARHAVRQAEARRADRLRELEAQTSLYHHDWSRFEARFHTFEHEVTPAARARVAAAEAAYRSGRGVLSEVLLARRALLDIELQSLSLAIDAVRSRLELEYFIQ